MKYVQIDNVTKCYGTTTVLGPVSCEFEKGQFITLLGPSGCGKSTLLRCIAGLIPMNSGKIIVDGEDITNTPPQRRGIGMVFQNYALFPNMTVTENISFGLEMQGIPDVDRTRRIKEVIAIVELGDYADRYPHQLSGGQKQRVALARSLVVRPRILLLDEPLSALDARIRRSLREDLLAIQRELQLTTIFVTHDQEEALTLSDRIVLMHNGSIEQDARAEELYSRPVSLFAAEFIGFRNILTPDAAKNALGLTPKQSISLRPENIHILHSGEVPPDTLHSIDGAPIAGKVTSRMILGTVVRYHLDVNGVDLVMDSLNRNVQHLIDCGTPVRLYFDASEIHEVH